MVKVRVRVRKNRMMIPMNAREEEEGDVREDAV